ncbi:MAG: decarboxylating 6-phosphogluconate dehydrogenase [Bradymonadales bacterium]|nr:decarboxylating 6-phosphogluconate dehydrogenase [Bradymonadales bacterium]
MQIGIAGLGRMGANLARRLLRDGHEVVVYNRTLAKVQQLEQEGATGSSSLDEFADRLRWPRAAWIMVPSGRPTEEMVLALADRFEAGDLIIDGGNSYFKDDIRRARDLWDRGIFYLDVGTSGGVWGLSRGYCLMIGGAGEAVERLTPVFRSLAPGAGYIPPTPGREEDTGTAQEGWLHCGPAGAGHFVKMVHNGIEYGLMQAYAEGFHILSDAGRMGGADYVYELDLAEIAEVWRRGSVISSWLLDLAATALLEDPGLAGYTGFVQDSGEGRWTLHTAIEQATPVDVLAAALLARFRSRQGNTFADKLLSAMRDQFGGHKEPPHDD